MIAKLEALRLLGEGVTLDPGIDGSTFAVIKLQCMGNDAHDAINELVLEIEALGFKFTGKKEE